MQTLRTWAGDERNSFHVMSAEVWHGLQRMEDNFVKAGPPLLGCLNFHQAACEIPACSGFRPRTGEKAGRVHGEADFWGVEQNVWE